ncbi:MAG: response regulator transcription factor [Parvibaculum sp.]|uniref:LuxR C-terminal-related transcriptional regulator n=1 Tax=Parvibaculum sp. TaxID=2024848 RepID=UPI003C76A1C2
MLLADANIAIVDSNHLFRAGMVRLLRDANGNTVRDARDLSALEELVKASEHFDLVLVELLALDGDPPGRVNRLRHLLPDCRVVVLSETLNSTQLCSCFAANVDGFLLKNISCETLTESLKLVLLDQKVFPSSLASLIAANGTQNGLPLAMNQRQPDSFAELSEREIEILRCLVDGDSNKRIALRLNIAEATVKVHLKSVLRKTHVMNRTQAAIWALNKGMQGRDPSI